MSTYNDDGLETISQDDRVPETRMKNAGSTQDFVRRLATNDERRSYKRSRVNGLVDGNPPYKASKLREAGRAEACNVNWGQSRAIMESGTGSFYDLFTEAPGYISVKVAYGTQEQRDTWSNIISQEIDETLKKDKVWDYQMQVSQWDMVLHGCGPFLFEDGMCILPRATSCGDLKVPEFAKSDTHYWEVCSIDTTYYPPELFKFVENKESAELAGWDVAYTRKVISDAMDIKQNTSIPLSWEFYQQELKNNSLNYYDNTKVCKLAHVFWKEFDGKITHAIVERTQTTGEAKYLFIHIGRYANFQEAIHPMYFDHGNGGYHHSVTGLGVKMYSAMEYENRLICNLADKAFAPKLLFKPTSSEGTQRIQMAQMGDYASLPYGVDVVQNPTGGYMNEGLQMHQTVTNLLQSNLASYRQMPSQKSGNPVTKFEKEVEAAKESSLNKTQFNRYYQQLDFLYAEIYRRLTSLNTTDERAQEFQKRCNDKGVPKEAFGRTQYVMATRVVGQGSPFMRKQAIDSLFAIAGSLPEEGRSNLIADKIASEAGQAAVNRYYPQKPVMATDQQAEAIQWTGHMKVGISPIVTSTQNPVTYASTYLKAATDALTSLEQGANPMEVLSFVNIAGPAIAQQLSRFSQDPTRAEVYRELSKQWQQLAKVTDELKQHVQEQQQAMAQQQQKAQVAMSDQELKMMKTKADIETKNLKTMSSLQQSHQKHELKMEQGKQMIQLKDAVTASDIRLKSAQAENEIAMKELQAYEKSKSPSGD